jgi:hypothetical protein
MWWTFEIPGQPPSWNASYKIVRRYRDGKAPFHTLAKTPDVIAYQSVAKMIIGAARPSRWSPSGQVRIFYWLYLSHDIDCDNIMKAIHDSIQAATGVDDKRFLPCVVSKEIVERSMARVRVIVSEDLASLSVAHRGWDTTRMHSSGS